MKIRIGYELVHECPRPTPMLLHLAVHHSHVDDLLVPDRLMADRPVPISGYIDGFGNWCSRALLPAGTTRLYADGLVEASGLPEAPRRTAGQVPVQDLPEEALTFLLGSRYCETDRLSDIAWQRFGNTPEGWGRVQAICDFVHSHIEFGYAFARSTKTAHDVYHERRGVCRDFAHLAVALTRCMNIPARYCTGYLGDMGLPLPHEAMDFAGWFEAYLEGGWHVFDARFNTPRIGRVLIARGRDAADVAISTAFGPNTLRRFSVVADEVPEPGEPPVPLLNSRP